MQNWKENLINFYRLSTMPLRGYRRRRLARSGSTPVHLLFYHRVSDSHANPWTIGCREFEAQLDWLGERFRFVSLAEAQRIIASGNNSESVVSITMDDGYAENLEFAIPLMLERRIPLNYFVCTDHVIYQQPFPHDILNGQPLPVNTLPSIVDMAKAGIEIGSHTRHHTDLGKITDKEQLYSELIDCSRDFEQRIGFPIRYFAFPYGQKVNLNRDAFYLLQEHGFQGACTTLPGFNAIGESWFELNRFHGDPSLARIKNWLDYDIRGGAGEKFYTEWKAGEEGRRESAGEQLLDRKIPLLFNSDTNSSNPSCVTPEH